MPDPGGDDPDPDTLFDVALTLILEAHANDPDDDRSEGQVVRDFMRAHRDAVAADLGFDPDLYVLARQRSLGQRPHGPHRSPTQGTRGCYRAARSPYVYPSVAPFCSHP